ncbi:MAG: hypothetical protein AAGK78_15710 [Planctomycetota bacterium]
MAAAKLLLLIVAGSYVLSGVLLGWMKHRGESVPMWFIAGWLACGVLGAASSWMLADGRAWAWWTTAVLLGPYMVLSLVWDIRHGAWVMVAVDVAGLFAIAWGLWQARAAL